MLKFLFENTIANPACPLTWSLWHKSGRIFLHRLLHMPVQRIVLGTGFLLLLLGLADAGLQFCPCNTDDKGERKDVL